MRWIYKLIEKRDDLYIYAYARESETLDGIIYYYVLEEKTEVIKLCTNDINLGFPDFLKEKAKQQFYHVIKDGFPAVRHVDCG